MRNIWISLSTGLLIGLLSAQTFASGFFVARFGGEHGHPTTDHLSAIYYNPAGLALGSGTRLTLDANLAWRIFEYNRPEDAVDNILEAGASGAGTPRDAVSSNTGIASLTNFIASPFAAVASDFGIEGFSAALGFYAPFGGASVYDKSDNLVSYPGALDGPQRWWAIEGTIRSIYITGAAAYRIKPLRLSFGIGLNAVKSEVFTVRARNSNGTDNVSSEGRALLDVAGTELSVGAGLIWEPQDDLYLGLSYQSSPNFGESELSGSAKLSLAGQTREFTTNPDVKYYQTLPDVWQFGVRWRMDPKNEVRLFGNYIPWSKLEYQCALDSSVEGATCELDGSAKLILLPRQWEDGYAVRFGASHWLNSGMEFFGGGGFDTNAVPDETLEPALFDTDKFTLSLGLKLRFKNGSLLSAADERTADLSVATTYTQVIYVAREIRARGKAPGDTVSDIEQFGFEPAQRQPDAAGSYEQSIGVLNLNFEYTF